MIDVPRRRFSIGLALLLATAAVVSGCSAPEPYDPTALDRSLTLPAGRQRVFEINLHMNATETLHYEWSIHGNWRVYFDIHRHDASGYDNYTISGQFNKHSGDYSQPENGTVSFMWVNDINNRPVELHYRFTGKYQVYSTNGP